MRIRSDGSREREMKRYTWVEDREEVEDEIRR